MEEENEEPSVRQMEGNVQQKEERLEGKKDSYPPGL